MKSNKKICHIASADITIKFLLLPQLKSLMRRGYQVYAVCSPGKWKESIEKEGIKLKNIAIKRRITPLSDLVALWHLFWYFRKEKFDIVHTHTPKPALLGQLAAKFAGVPVIINTVHGLYFSDNTPFLQRIFYTFIEKISAKCSTLIFSQNKEDISVLTSKKITLPEKIKYLGNGTDLGKFNPERFTQDYILSKKIEFKISPGYKIIGTVGRLVKEKGYFDLFSAFKKVLEKYPKTLLLVVGPEDKEKGDAFSPEIIKRFGIEENVIFLGERTDMEEIYPLMDIFVLASWREGFPRTVIEAMAAQRPIITTDIRGCKEAIKNNENGILVSPKNPAKLAEAMIFVMENPDKAEKMAKNARKKAEEEFDENLVFGKIREEYLKLGGGPKKVLIAGGAGFVGSHLANSLINFKNKVIVVDNFSGKSRGKLNKKAKIYNADIKSRELEKIFKKEKPEIVFNLAGPIKLRESKEDNFSVKDDFVKDFENLLNCSSRFNVKKFIFISSGGAIYENSKVPSPEDCETFPSSLYGRASIFLENKLENLAKEQNLNYCILRFPNIYGPGQWESGVIPSFIKQAKSGKVVINGDGGQTRDFIYIDDTVSALMMAAKAGSGILNAGSGEETSLNELLQKLLRILGAKAVPVYTNTKERVMKSALDCRKIEKVLGWRAKTSLDDGLKKTIGHYQSLKIKICHVTTVDITARFIILNFLKDLKESGFDVALVCSPGKFSKFLTEQSIKLKNIKMTRRLTPLADFISFLKLLIYFKKEKFDIVHTYTPKAGVLGRVAARLAGTPLVIHTSYGFYIGVEMSRWLKLVVLYAEKIASFFCDFVYSQNNEDISWAIKKRVVPKSKIKNLSYGIDLDRFNSKKFSTGFIEEKKNQLGLRDKKIIGIVGRFVKEKGFLDLFEAFRLIKAAFPESALLLVAPEDKEKNDALDISVLKEYGIEKDTIVLGYKKEVLNMEEVYPLMDVFVLPSYREGFPYSIMEASSSSIPVVATDIRGCREAVENDKTGLLFPAGDYKKLAEIIIFLFKNPNMMIEMGINGRKRAVKEFDEKLVFDRIKKEYERLLKEKS